MKIMKKYDQSVEINHNPKWPYITNHPYRIFGIGSSRSGKTNVLLKIIKDQLQDFDKSYLYVNYPFESKYQLLINTRKTMDDVYENSEDYNTTKKGEC